MCFQVFSNGQLFTSNSSIKGTFKGQVWKGKLPKDLKRERVKIIVKITTLILKRKERKEIQTTFNSSTAKTKLENWIDP